MGNHGTVLGALTVVDGSLATAEATEAPAEVAGSNFGRLNLGVWETEGAAAAVALEAQSPTARVRGRERERVRRDMTGIRVAML